MSNTTPPESSGSNLSPEIQKQLTALNAQINANSVNDNLQKELKKVISALLTENIILKRENSQLKAEKSSKS